MTPKSMMRAKRNPITHSLFPFVAGSKTPYSHLLSSAEYFQTGFGYMGVLSTSSVDTLKRQLYCCQCFVSNRLPVHRLGSILFIQQVDSRFKYWNIFHQVPYGSIYTYNGPPEDGGTWIPNLENTGLRYWDKRLNFAQITYTHSPSLFLWTL